ncbi:MAG: polysaccharide deacetylase family protein, partial [Clostridia bacterium]
MPWGELAGAALLLWLVLYPMADLAGRRLQVNALIGDGRALTVALTFDIESRRQWEEILADLRAAGAPAALFVTGQLALQHPDLARRTREEGHDLGSRGFTGQSPGRLSPWAAVADIRRGRAAVGAAAGAFPKWYRPGPGHESLFSVWAPAWFGQRRVLGQVRVTPAHQDPARFVARFAFAGVVVRFEAGAARPGLAGEVTARLQAEGLAIGRLEELHPETSLVRRGWYWWEGEFTRRYDVETLAASDGGPPMLRLGVAPYRGFPLLADGAE